MAEKRKYGIKGLMSISGSNQEHKIDENLFKGLKKEDRPGLETRAYSKAQAWHQFGIKFARALGYRREGIFLGNAEVYEIEEIGEKEREPYYQPELF